MRASLIILAALSMAAPVAAQIMPEPSFDNPRVQSARWQPGQDIFLTALPATGLTIILEPGEQISRVELDDGNLIDAKVSAENDSLLLVPKRNGELGSIRVQTDRRFYQFSLRTGSDLMAAYVIQMDYSPPSLPPDFGSPGFELANGLAAGGPLSNEQWSYRLKGDNEVWPSAIQDDGVRTTIDFAPDQALPAVFAIGPSGKEQVVNGHMRSGKFVIDRVWQELIFRIDKEKATAKRNSEPDSPVQENGNG
jgi:type IV secretion system protein VirB9